MFPVMLSKFAFQLRRLARARPALSIATGVSALLFAGAAASVWELRQAKADALALINSLQRTAQVSSVQPPVDLKVIVPISLQPFNSAQMVQVFNDVAEKTSVPLNEVSFTLDEGSAQPFMRYRASFAVQAKYPAIRRFIDSVHSELHDVSLDSIACTRETLEAQFLKCDLVFSAFYAKEISG